MMTAERMHPLSQVRFATLNIHKPVGMTSHDVVARLRRVFGLKKIGHLGTLDPLAEGVLPVCLGQATRLIEYFPSDKRYRASVTLGRTTTTLDAEGEEVSRMDCSGMELSPERLEAVLSAFRGIIRQQVPLYSAVHVGGKKLYKLAREGKTADLPVRETRIDRLTLAAGPDWEQDPAHPVLTLDVHCASGTYIRSLARDIGETLGCGAYMSALVRTGHGRFDLADAVPLQTLQESDDPTAFLKDPVPWLDLPVLHLGSEQAHRLRNGMKADPAALAEIPENQGANPGKPAATLKLKPNAFYMTLWNGLPVGVVQCVSGLLKPIKIFPSAE
jgi:tRNA pseudouridine55 synthase